MKLSLLLLSVHLLTAPVLWATEPEYQGKPLSHWLSQAKDKDPNVRFRATEALGEMGAAAKAAVPTLAELLRDKEWSVRKSAALALRKIEPRADKREEVIAKSLAPGQSAGGRSEIEITLEGPSEPPVLGRPIRLTAVFKSNLNRDAKIEGFSPEMGQAGSACMVCADGFGVGSVTSRSVKATTEIKIERLSGKPSEDEETVHLGGCGNGRSLILKAGGSGKLSFDLMETPFVRDTVNSPGRFRVSLVFRVEAEASEGYEHDPLEWEGETRSPPIEITVTAKKN